MPKLITLGNLIDADADTMVVAFTAFPTNEEPMEKTIEVLASDWSKGRFGPSTGFIGVTSKGNPPSGIAGKGKPTGELLNFITYVSGQDDEDGEKN